MVCSATAEFHQLDGHHAFSGSYDAISTPAADFAFAVATLAGGSPGVEWEGAGGAGEADAAAGTKSAATAIAMCTWENGHS